MPAFGAAQTPTALSSGEKIAVLNGEDLAENALTMAISLTPVTDGVWLAIYNQSGETVNLVGSPDFTAANYLPVTDISGGAITAATDTITVCKVATALNYAIQAAAAITDGTVYLAR